MQFINDSVIVTFLLDHLLDISLIVLIAIFAIVKIKRWIKNYLGGDTGKAMKIIYSLVIEAEKDLGSKTGQLKKKQVISKVYKQLPVCIRFVVNEATVERFINEAVHFMKEALEQNNSNLASLSEESACMNLPRKIQEDSYNEVNNEEEAKG